jgi:hypothetical protein
MFNQLINYLFGTKLHVHEWEYLGSFGISYQQKRCKTCGKLKIEEQ